MSTAPAPASALVPATTLLEQSQESAIATLQRAAIGPVHPDYYLSIFERFEAAGRAGPSWNWPACLCTLNWMLFRKLWWPALLYLAAVLSATLLVFGMGPLLLQFSDTEKRSLLVALATFAFLVPGVFGNAMLHSKVRGSIAGALAASGTLAEACVLLKRQSSSRQRLMGLAAANVALAGALVAGWLALPGPFGANLPSVAGAQAVPMGAVVPASAPAAPVPTPAIPASTPMPAVASAAASAASTAAQPPAAAASASGREAVASASAPATVGVLTPAEQDARAASMAPYVTRRAPLSAAPPLPASQALTPAEQDARAASMAAYVPRRPLLPAAPAAAAEAPASSTPVAQPARAAASAPPAAPKPARKAAAASAPAMGASRADATMPPDAVRSYFINVGLFAEEANARRAIARLQEAGLPVLQTELAAAKGTRWRVRAGPFPARDEADAAAGKIRALQLEAVVVRP